MSKLQQYYMRSASVHRNVPLRIFENEKGMESTEILDQSKLYHNITEKELFDIRDSPAYHAYVALISGGDVNYNKNGYKALAKPYRQEIKFVAGNLMEVQLREIITKSVQTLGNFIKGFLTLEELKAVTGKPIRKIRPLVRTLSQTSSQAAEKADEENRK